MKEELDGDKCSVVNVPLGSGEARDFEVGGFCKRHGSTRTGGLGDEAEKFL